MEVFKMKHLQEILNDNNDVNGMADINNMSNKELVEFYLEHVEDVLSLNTHIQYKRHLNNFLEFIEDFSISEIRPFHLDHWIKQQKNIKNITKKIYLVSVSSFFKHITINGYIMGNGNPALAALANIKDTKPKQYEPLSIDDIKKIIKNTISPRDRAIILMLFKTGCRISEIANLVLSDVDLEKNIIYIRNRKHHGKNDEPTQIPIDAELKIILQNWLRFRLKGKSDHLFVGYYGKGMTITRHRDIVTRCGENVGIMNAHSHRYRYSFTTVMSKKCNPAVITYLRGDSAKTMVEYYTKPSQEFVKEEYLRTMPKLL